MGVKKEVFTENQWENEKIKEWKKAQNKVRLIKMEGQ